MAEVDYIQKLRDDTIEQFKDKPIIDAFHEAIGIQLNDVRQFYEDLRDKRGVQTATGAQLDGAGDIVVLTRTEAGELACLNKSVYVLEDEDYRKYIIFKIWKNSNNCTYYDVIKALRMFWDRPLYYREDPEYPATMVFETDKLDETVDIKKLFDAPIIRAAGVGVKIIANVWAEEMGCTVWISGGMGKGFIKTDLPEFPFPDLEDTMQPVPAFSELHKTVLPEFQNMEA